MNNSFYFSHDYNARSDDKIKKLIRFHGMEGYGIFWAIVEDLYNNANALRLDCEGIAYELRVDANVVEHIINDYDLFIIEEDIFGSKSIEDRLDERNKKSESARQSAFKRWNKKKVDANAMRTQCDGNAIKDIKEIKEIKEINNVFEIFRKEYPGSKRGTDIELENLKKHHKDWRDVIPILSEKLSYQKDAREKKRVAGGFVPEWKNLQTWINQRCWEEEIGTEIIKENKSQYMTNNDMSDLRELKKQLDYLPNTDSNE